MSPVFSQEYLKGDQFDWVTVIRCAGFIVKLVKGDLAYPNGGGITGGNKPSIP